MRIANDTNVECWSNDATDCVWDDNCDAYVASGTSPAAPLECGCMHKQVWGTVGYDDPAHWCSCGKIALGANPTNPDCTPAPSPLPTTTPAPTSAPTTTPAPTTPAPTSTLPATTVLPTTAQPTTTAPKGAANAKRLASLLALKRLRSVHDVKKESHVSLVDELTDK
ncbi:unnamed protein product [Aphanomyces euteiches]